MFEILLALTIATQAAEPDPVTVPSTPAPFDHLYSDFTRFLRGAVSSQGLDYAALASRREHLDALVSGLVEQGFDIRSTCLLRQDSAGGGDEGQIRWQVLPELEVS